MNLPPETNYRRDLAMVHHRGFAGHPGNCTPGIIEFLPNLDGSWRRDDEHHDTVLIDTAQVPARLHEHGVQAQVGSSFGPEINPPGLVVVTGHKPAAPGGGPGALASGGD